MSTLKPSSTKPYGLGRVAPEWSSNPLARAIGEEAVARLEVEKRFAPVVDELRTLTIELAQQDAVDGDLVRGVLELGRDFADFARAEFSFDGGDFAPEHFSEGWKPQGETIAFLRLATERLRRSINTATTIDDAIQNYEDAWESAKHVPGLANWPRFLREIDSTQQAHGVTDDSVGLSLKELRNHWVKVIEQNMTGEGLLLESYQSPTLLAIGDEFLRNDIEPARRQLVAALDGTLQARVGDMPTDIAQRLLGRLVVELDEIKALGDEWVASSRQDVDLLAGGRAVERADLTESLLLDDHSERLGINVGKHIVIVNPHDDDEVLVQHLIAHEIEAGNAVSIVTMTDSSAGDPQAPGMDVPGIRRTFAEQRRIESRDAAIHLGLKGVHRLNFGDSGMPGDPSPHRIGFHLAPNALVETKLKDVLRRLEPDVVLTRESHASYEHPDHWRTAEVVDSAVNALNAEGNAISLYHIGLDEHDLRRRYIGFGLHEFPELAEMSLPEHAPTTRIAVGVTHRAAGRIAGGKYATQVARVDSSEFAVLRRVVPESAPSALETELTYGSFAKATADKPFARQPAAIDRGLS